MNEHELCCGTVANKAKLCAEIEQRDLVIAEQQRRIGEMAEQVERLKQERDDALALVIRYQRLLDSAIRGEEFIVGDAILIGIDAELADEIDESVDESPKAALAALKAQWQAEVISELKIHMMNNGYEDEADGVVAWFEERQRAQEAANAPNP